MAPLCLIWPDPAPCHPPQPARLIVLPPPWLHPWPHRGPVLLTFITEYFPSVPSQAWHSSPVLPSFVSLLLPACLPSSSSQVKQSEDCNNKSNSFTVMSHGTPLLLHFGVSLLFVLQARNYFRLDPARGLRLYDLWSAAGWLGGPREASAPDEAPAA